MRKLLNNHSRLVAQKAELRNYYKEKFDHNEESHIKMLIAIWEKIQKTRDINLVDKRWRNQF
jgi:hypothetical protein